MVPKTPVFGEIWPYLSSFGYFGRFELICAGQATMGGVSSTAKYSHIRPF